MRKTLFLCNGNNVRSICAQRMARKCGARAMSAGVDSKFDDELLEFLCGTWAERICICGPDTLKNYEARFGDRWAEKLDLHYVPIGLDHFKWDSHPVLFARVLALIESDPQLQDVAAAVLSGGTDE